MLSDYIQPPIDPSIDEALMAYMQSRKDSEPDAFG
jgi:trimethylamine--corrinoid protein Co-methyltransferase